MLTFSCDAVLFDMDGTLVDSNACVEKLWREWAAPHNVDIERLLKVCHGRRNRDVIPEVAPHLDAERESARFDAREILEREGIRAVTGAAAFIAALPSGSWAVVTSASRELATVRLECAGLPIPEVLICADDVRHGKPDPEGYALAARRLGVPPERCLVVEDTPPGLAAGIAAGMRVLGVTTTHSREALSSAPCVGDFALVRVSPDGLRGFRIEISAN
jgi:sugar-phosphatase